MYGEDDNDTPLWVPLLIALFFAVVVIGIPLHLTSDKVRRLTPELIAEDSAKCKSMGGSWYVAKESSGKNMGKPYMAWCNLPIEPTEQVE